MVKRSAKKRKVKKPSKSKKKLTPKKKKDYQDEILKKFFLVLGGIFILIFLVITFAHLSTNFNYEGVDFTIVNEENLLLYQTSIPVIYKGDPVQYNFYLRNDPRDLKKDVDFVGEIQFAETMVLNSSNDFHCDGDGIISIANVAQLYQILGVEVIQDSNATCDSEGRYLFLNLNDANETSVVQTGPGCYEFSISNCEILEATERYMVETFIEINENQI